MKSAEVFDGYVDRSWRFLAELQRSNDMEFVVGKREGPYIWNIENTRRILECGNSGGLYSLGHRNPEILQTLLEAYGRLDAERPRPAGFLRYRTFGRLPPCRASRSMSAIVIRSRISAMASRTFVMATRTAQPLISLQSAQG